MLPLADWLMFPLIDDAVACVAAGMDLRVTALVDGDVRPQGQNGPRAGRVIFVEIAVPDVLPRLIVALLNVCVLSK